MSANNREGGLYMGCVIFQCYPYGLANANADNFNGGGVPLHGFVTALIVNSSDI